MTKFEEERKRFPAVQTQTYLETSGTGLIPDYVYEGIKHFQDGRYLKGGDADWGGYGTIQMLQNAREYFGEMLHCSKEDIYFGSNTSQVMSVIFGGFPFQKGDNVITSEWTFFGQKYAWSFLEKEGVEVRYIPLDHGVISLDMIKPYMDERTVMVCLDFVENSTGYRINAKEIGTYCREKGIWFITDACQAVGAIDIDVQNMCIDYLAGNDYKWMMNYCGTGYAYISKELRSLIQQRTCGWMADKDLFVEKETIDLREDAARFEFGYPNVSGIFGLSLVAKKFCELGKKDVEEYIVSLMDYLQAQVEELPGVHFWSDYPKENRSGIAILCFDENVSLTNEDLEKAHIVAHIRDGKMYGYPKAMRIGAHYYNNLSDIDQLVDVIKKSV